MSNVNADPQGMKTGFWKKLVLAAEASCESYGERLEKRVGRLEAEVERLLETQEKRLKDLSRSP